MADSVHNNMEGMEVTEVDDEVPIVHILIASDVHAGFAENKPFIGNDSFESFREVLSVAAESKVDFVLLAGDLFHENHPSRESQLKVVRLLRKYCFRDGQHPNLEFVSDPTVNFQHSNFPVANFLDENLRVRMPIFTIHGNHDDLSGKGLSALDVLHESGLINLFGKFCDVEHIEVTPILLCRGNTKIALYGIGSQRDDRLARSFAKGRVKFVRPQDDDLDSWFSILVLHQNRPPRSKLRSTKSHLSFKHIPLFFDLVIWGHEHECLIEPDFKYMDPNDSTQGFYIVQPGSTVATALSIEESKKKHIGILSIRGKEFRMKKIPLETTRQVIVEEMELEEVAQPVAKIPKTSVRLKNMPDEPLITERIRDILSNAEANRGPQQPWPPRVRLKVVYSGKWVDIPPIIGRKWGPNHFADKVANASEMIVTRVKHPDTKAKNVHDPQLRQVLGGRGVDDVCSVDDMVNKYYNQCDFKHSLNVLSEIAMGKQLQEYSNTEVNTQFKYSAADKALNESIREQMNAMTTKVREMVQSKINENPDEDLALEQHIVQSMMVAKRQRMTKVEPRDSLDETAQSAASFLESGFDHSRLVSSTPRSSQCQAPSGSLRRGLMNEINDEDFDSP